MSLIGPEQVGFMPGREAKDNVIKVLLLTHAAHTGNIGGLLLSTGVEKAFDKVARHFMMAVCERIGLGPRMMARIAALYQNPSVKLKMNATLSNKVLISNVTR